MTVADYRNFDLLMTRSGERYKAIVVDAPAGEASVLFDLPFVSDDLTRLGGLARSMHPHGIPAGERGQTVSLTDLGSQLFDAVFSDQIRALLAASLSSVAEEGVGLRLRLRFEEDAANLALLPWETLYDSDQRCFVGLGEGSPIVRYLSLPRSRSAMLVEPPLRVLALLASPTDLPQLDTQREWHAIQDALTGLADDGKFTLEQLAKPTVSALQERLLGDPVHIIHFVGHGIFDASHQTGSLALEDNQGRSHLLRGENLAELLRNHPTVRLAYLNACEGALASGQSVFSGVAQALVQGGVPAAVAMQAEISDPGAIDLARTFYTAVAAGRPVDAALTQARVALAAAGNPEWAIPVLFSRSPDNRLFDIRQVLPTPDCPYPGMIPFNEAQQHLFFGRGREIEDAVESLRQHPFLAVVGASGSGKSSLIYAGVIPALRKTQRFGPGDWQIKSMRPGDSRTISAQAAPRQALAELLGCASDALVHQRFDQRTLLFIDQFEELFTLAETSEAQAFLDIVKELVGRPNLYILLTVRADFYPELMACPLWDSIRANRLELPPLGDNELWAAIVEPAGRVGVTVDEALAATLIADAAGEQGALPLVQETLVLLWDKVESRQLRLAAYRGMAEGTRSGLQVAIDRRANLVYDNLPVAAQPLARRIFLRLIQFGEGRADTRRQQSVAELRASGDDLALFNQTLAQLIESRLVTTSGEIEEGKRQVDIAHEALISGWSRLQAWLGQRSVAERTRRRLEGKTDEWMRLGKSGGLLDEYELHDAQEWLTSADAAELGVSQDLLQLVTISENAIAAIEAERVTQQRRELEQAQKLAAMERLRAEETDRSARRLRRWLMGTVAAVVIAVIAFVVAAGSAVLARSQLNRMAALSHLQEAYELKQQGDAQGAIEQFRQAESIQADLGIDYAAEIADVRRQVATHLVQEAEALARSGDFAPAEAKLRSALALEPPPDTPVYVYVPAGEFVMGATDPDFADQSPTHKVDLDAYWMQRTEVTNAQYRRCVEAGQCEAPSDRNVRYLEPQSANLPVAGVTWSQAQTYAKWVGGRLPTEAEWEKACRGADGRVFAWGDTNPTKDLANFFRSGYEIWTSVGSYPGGASPYGVLDMAGNVAEWTSSAYKNYPYDPEDGREDQTNDDTPRVLRGGSYFAPDFFLRCTHRDSNSPNWGNIYWGFRVVLAPE